MKALWIVLALVGASALAAPREKVLFDTDIGGDPDDGMALTYLLREPRCELLGITTCCGRPEVVQLYVHDMLFTVARPDCELRGFRRVTLEPGETKDVAFELTAKELGFWNRDREYVVEPGEFRVWLTDCFSPNMAKERDAVVYTAK